MISKLNLYLNKAINPTIIIFCAALARLVPHMPNFTPIGAMALFGGAYLNKKWALGLPLAAMFISDIFIGFDSLSSRVGVYSSFVLIGLIGLWLRNNKSLVNVVFSALGASVLFFLITNFEVWLFSGMYTKDLSGLLNSYVSAVPFFRGTLLGDLFYTGVFFGGYELVTKLTRNRKLAFAERSSDG